MGIWTPSDLSLPLLAEQKKLRSWCNPSALRFLFGHTQLSQQQPVSSPQSLGLWVSVEAEIRYNTPPPMGAHNS